jgi:hypothetical protein
MYRKHQKGDKVRSDNILILQVVDSISFSFCSCRSLETAAAKIGREAYKADKNPSQTVDFGAIEVYTETLAADTAITSENSAGYFYRTEVSIGLIDTRWIAEFNDVKTPEFKEQTNKIYGALMDTSKINVPGAAF